MIYTNNFVIIDDDKINHFLCKKLLAKLYPESVVVNFLDAPSGLKYLEESFLKSGAGGEAIMFLDIAMPIMDAWGFLDEYDKLDEAIKDKIKICVLSSSIDSEDEKRAIANKYVAHYVVKPLTKDAVNSMINLLGSEH